VKVFLKSSWVLFMVFILSIIVVPSSTFAEKSDGDTRKVEGVIIIINDLIIANEKGLLVTHETKRDSNLNVQAEIRGNVRVRDDGYWIYKKGLELEFISAKMYLTDEITVPVTVKVLTDELNEEETMELPILIKGENDTVGKRLQMQINGGMMAGIFLPFDRQAKK